MTYAQKALIGGFFTFVFGLFNLILALIAFVITVYFVVEMYKPVTIKPNRVPYIKPLSIGYLKQLPDGKWTYTFFDAVGKEFESDLLFISALSAENNMKRYVADRQLTTRRVESNGLPPFVPVGDRKDKVREAAKSRRLKQSLSQRA